MSEGLPQVGGFVNDLGGLLKTAIEPRAKTYLKKAGLLQYPERGSFEITDRGLKVLERDPDRIDNKYLRRFEEFRETADSSGGTEQTEEEDKTPLERLEDAHQSLEDELKAEVLDQLRDVDPTKFEHIVIDVLVAMGYGGSREDVGKNIGGSGDQGVDGLGLHINSVLA